ncbi:cation-translocating P-type ATPase [Candidatus Gottesmanbacteria bacterium]|nr:cation-translocating P-type ATPase [Candidatus Gottesmanbacteria bacterium]
MYYQKSIAEILKELQTHPNTGLTFPEAEKRLKKYGPNILPSKKPPSLIWKFLSQFKSFLVILLLAATALSAFLGDFLDAIAIFAIVILNAAVGTLQELKAERTLSQLEQLDLPESLVLRDGHLEKVPTDQIVLGDIIILEEGVKIPADGRIIENFSLSIDESILTGESQTTNKITGELTTDNIPLGDQKNMIFKDTQVVSGRGKAVVVATGSSTEIGKIALSLEEAPDELSPLSEELDRVGKMLTGAVIAIAIVIFIITSIRGVKLIDRILIAVALSVAAIPEGLPAIATITLALGVERLAKKKTVTKKLTAVETLGAVKIIATDKTGTITENKMNVTDIVTADGKHFQIEAEGYKTKGTFFSDQKPIIPQEFKQIYELLECAILANNAFVKLQQVQLDTEQGRSVKKKDDTFEIVGDTTEAALLIAGERAGLPTDKIKSQNSRIFEMPFSADRKMMSVVVKIDDTDDVFIFVKGAPEIVMNQTTLSSLEKTKFARIVNNLASKGLRTLALGRRKLSKKEVKDVLENNHLPEDNLEFLGIMGARDTLRLDIKDALLRAKSAGIKTIMITGDHISTAISIGLESGIIEKGNQAIAEKDFEDLSRIQIAHLIKTDKYRIFARVSPLGKLKLIESIKLLPATRVAVTGDGVNDAPALKVAHVGLAMGSGTDIAREVSDMVITDDNYSTIIEAIKEGRIIFANLIKFIRYLISCNLAEIVVVTLAVIFGTPLPLIPIQLLWINLITDGLPALALGNDPPEYDVMLKPPRAGNTLLHKRRWTFMFTEGLVMGISVFMLYLFSLLRYDLLTAQTIAFTTLCITQLIHALSNRSTRTSLFILGFFSNKHLIYAIIFSFFLQVLVIYTNFGQIIFKTVTLNFYHWIAIMLVSFIPFFFVELKKLGLKQLKI